MAGLLSANILLGEGAIMKKLWMLLVLLAVGVVLAACGPQARVKGSEEGSLVGSKKAGAETYNQLVGRTVEKLLADRDVASGKRMLLCFVDIENMSAEELADNREAMYEEIDTIIVNSKAYTNVSRRYVEAALRATGLRVEEIFLGDGRKKFMSVLGKEGITPDYLMWGKVTSLSTEGTNRREREYLLTLELVDAKTGITEAKKTDKVRKEYNK